MSWGSWLSGADAAGATESQPNFRSVTDRPQDALFGQLEKSDLEWTCAGGFATETQTWYTVLENGALATSQIIHSGVGLWYPQIQVTFKYFNPKTGEKVWKSLNVSKFETPAPAGTGRDKSKVHDKRSCKGEQFSVLYDELPDGSESYTIEANMDTDLQLSYTFTRSKQHAGWKLGKGPQGGKSYFGANEASPDGYVVHRFWPRVTTVGHILIKGQAIDAKGQGMFVHAIQGMRPNLVASRWNFANFQSSELGGVSTIMMEFTTTSDYGGPAGSAAPVAGSDAPTTKREAQIVTIGSVSVGDQLVAVTGATRGSRTPAGEAGKGSATATHHLERVEDPETTYLVPQAVRFNWDGPLLVEGKAQADQKVQADLTVQLGKPFPRTESLGLVDKVDVLGEIPYVVRKVVNVVAGTKPYIYQTLNETTLNFTLPDGFAGEAKGSHSVKGSLFAETSFISE